MINHKCALYVSLMCRGRGPEQSKQHIKKDWHCCCSLSRRASLALALALATGPVVVVVTADNDRFIVDHSSRSDVVVTIRMSGVRALAAVPVVRPVGIGVAISIVVIVVIAIIVVVPISSQVTAVCLFLVLSFVLVFKGTIQHDGAGVFVFGQG
jgi:uncharacterized Tic20 family protein